MTVAPGLKRLRIPAPHHTRACGVDAWNEYFKFKTTGFKVRGGATCRCENNIRMDFKGIGCEGVDWIHLAQARIRWGAVVNTVMNLRVP
jgi:hypothetical protein